jgi:hypothetical protein
VARFCEVKSPRDDWLEGQLEQAPPGTIVGGPRQDPRFNRIARHVLKAVTQFETVNADRKLPNVLVFVNHDDHSHYGDLRETLTGHFHADSGAVYETMTRISNGVLGEKRSRIDLYLWIDDNRRCRRIGGWFWSDAVPAHTAVLRTLLLNILPRTTAAA